MLLNGHPTIGFGAEAVGLGSVEGERLYYGGAMIGTLVGAAAGFVLTKGPIAKTAGTVGGALVGLTGGAIAGGLISRL